MAPQLAALTRAPDAPRPAAKTPTQKQLDKGMTNIARLRLKHRLEPLWAQAAALAAQQPLASAPPSALNATTPTALR